MTRASFLRLYSVQIITEHDRPVKLVVPCPWVVDFLELSPGDLKVKRLFTNTLHHGLPLKKIGQYMKLLKHFSSREQGKRQIKYLNLAQEKILQMKVVSF